MSAALAVAQSAQTVSTGEAIAFWILAPIALAGAIGMVLARNAVHSALFLVMTMLSLGVFYVLQQGPFIGVVQIIVYTGAIMILFLFVLMLVGRDASDSIVETLRGQRVAAAVFGVGFAGLVTAALTQALSSVQSLGNAKGLGAQAGYKTNVGELAGLLFTRYVFAFEVTSALLITAAVGAMVLAHIERPKDERSSQRDLSRQRFRDGGYPGPLPGPGVFATSNSVATPALLPDGSGVGTELRRGTRPEGESEGPGAVMRPISVEQARTKDQT
ncbi:MAG: NADH-quinone oxidoreductase subunit J [Mycobacteriales bacterium]